MSWFPQTMLILCKFYRKLSLVLSESLRYNLHEPSFLQMTSRTTGKCFEEVALNFQFLSENMSLAYGNTAYYN